MRYFQDVLQKAVHSRTSPVEISVHCDIGVFEWLLGYCHGQSTREHITVDRVLALLIASNFLQMDGLVSDCLAFMAEHLAQVVHHHHQEQGAGQGGGDLTALPLELLARLARVVPERTLELLAGGQAPTEEAGRQGVLSRSRGGAPGPRPGPSPGPSAHMPLVHRLYKYKLEGCLRELRTTLARCSVCLCFFSLADRTKLDCPGPPPHPPLAAPGPRRPNGGGGSAVHIPDASWRLQDHLASLRAQGVPWRGIYWHVWGLVHVLYCHACMRHVPAADLRRCTFHPQPPVFTPGPGPGAGAAAAAGGAGSYATGRSSVLQSGAATGPPAGFFPCCGAAAATRGSDPRVIADGGCCARDHRVLPSGLAPGAPLPPGVTPALLDTLRCCSELFTNPAALMLPEPGAAVGEGAVAEGTLAAAVGGGGNAEGGRSTALSSQAARGRSGGQAALGPASAAPPPASGAASGGGTAGKGTHISSRPDALARSGVAGGSGSDAQGDGAHSGQDPRGPAVAAIAAALSGSSGNSAELPERGPGLSGPGPPRQAAAAAATGTPTAAPPPSSAAAPLAQHQTAPATPPKAKGSGAALAASAPAPGSPLAITGDPKADARIVAAAVVRRLAKTGSGSGRGLGAATGAAATAAAQGLVPRVVDESLPARGAPSPGPQSPSAPSAGPAVHACSYTSLAALQKEAADLAAAAAVGSTSDDESSGSGGGHPAHALHPGARMLPGLMPSATPSSPRAAGAGASSAGGLLAPIQHHHHHHQYQQSAAHAPPRPQVSSQPQPPAVALTPPQGGGSGPQRASVGVGSAGVRPLSAAPLAASTCAPLFSPTPAPPLMPPGDTQQPQQQSLVPPLRSASLELAGFTSELAALASRLPPELAAQLAAGSPLRASGPPPPPPPCRSGSGPLGPTDRFRGPRRSASALSDDAVRVFGSIVVGGASGGSGGPSGRADRLMRTAAPAGGERQVVPPALVREVHRGGGESSGVGGMRAATLPPRPVGHPGGSAAAATPATGLPLSGESGSPQRRLLHLDEDGGGGGAAGGGGGPYDDSKVDDDDEELLRLLLQEEDEYGLPSAVARDGSQEARRPSGGPGSPSAQLTRLSRNQQQQQQPQPGVRGRVNPHTGQGTDSGDRASGGGAGTDEAATAPVNPLQRSVQAALMQQRQRQQPLTSSPPTLQPPPPPPAPATSHPHPHSDLRSRQRSAGRIRQSSERPLRSPRDTHAGASTSTRPSLDPPQHPSQPRLQPLPPPPGGTSGPVHAVTGAEREERRALIEQYKTQQVLSPRPANFSLISISDLPGAAGPAGNPGSGSGVGSAAGLEVPRSSGEQHPHQHHQTQQKPAISGDAATAGAPAVAGGGRLGEVALWGLAAGNATASTAGNGPSGAYGPLAAAAAATTAAVAGYGRSASGGRPAGVGAALFDVLREDQEPPGPPSPTGWGPGWGAGGAGGGGGLSAADSGSAAGGMEKLGREGRGRKLRMELLYEDDNYRMDLLVQHLLACRPSTRGVGAGTRGEQQRAATGASSRGTRGAGSGRTGGGGGSLVSGGGSGYRASRSFGSAARPASAAAAAAGGGGAVPSSGRQTRPRSRSVSHLQRLQNVYSSGVYGSGAAAAAAQQQQQLGGSLSGNASSTLYGMRGGITTGPGDGGGGDVYGSCGAGMGHNTYDSRRPDAERGSVSGGWGKGSAPWYGGGTAVSGRSDARPLSAPRVRRFM